MSTDTSRVPTGALRFAAGALVGMVGWRIHRTWEGIRRGRDLAQRTRGFQRLTVSGAPAVLVVGDSLAVGVGAAHPDETVPGRIALRWPGIAVHNVARSGALTADLGGQLDRLPRRRYAVALVAVGANDVIRNTPRAAVRASLHATLERLACIAAATIVVTSANVGGAPLVPWPLSRMLTSRSRAMRDLFRQTCARDGVALLDMFSEPREDPFRRRADLYYGADGLHPSSLSYGACFARLVDETPLCSLLDAASARRSGMRRAPASGTHSTATRSRT